MSVRKRTGNVCDLEDTVLLLLEDASAMRLRLRKDVSDYDILSYAKSLGQPVFRLNGWRTLR